MGWIPDRYRVLRALVWGERPDRDVAEEFEHHLTMRTEENVAKGMTPEEARGEALRRFGDLNAYRTETRRIDERIVEERRRTELLDALRRELRGAVRSLARSPAFTLIAIMTLALGIGAATAIYTLVDRVVLHPLSYPNEQRLVWIESRVSGNATGSWGLSEAGYFYYREHSRTLDGLGVYATTGDITVLGDGGAEQVPGALTSATLFDVLGLRTVLGRGITADDDRPADHPVAAGVVVLSHRFWTSRFNRDPGILGKAINVGGMPLEIIGVLAPGEELPDDKIDVWLPAKLNPANRPVNDHSLRAIGRLKGGVSIDAAQREIAQLTTRFPELFPGAYSAAFMQQYHFTPVVLSLRDHVIGGAAKGLWILLAAVGLVLLIAGANVANLFLARLEARRRELAIRTALGAERVHLAWHYLTESLLLTLLAGACALALAYGGIHLLLAIAPSSIPRLAEVHLSASSLAFTAIVSLAAGVIFGSLPIKRRDVDVGTLRDGSRGLTAARGQHAARGLLVVGQVALALILLAAAGLLLQSFRHLRNVKPGFDPTGVLAVDVSIPFNRYRTYEEVGTFYHELQTRISGLPGVVSVGATHRLPLDSWGGCAPVHVQDRSLAKGELAPCSAMPRVSPGYFETMRIPVRGETPTWSDVENHVSGVVVSRALAERLWPGEDPIGKGVNNGGVPPFFRVAGVADDVRAEDLQKPPVEAVYYPMIPITGGRLWGPTRAMIVVVRTRLPNPQDLAPAIRRIATEMDREVPIGRVRTMEQVVARSMARVSFTMLLLGIAAGMALVLSAVGIYGVISYIVGQRRGEIGIRMALGARTAQVGGLVVLQSVRLAAAGVVLGLVGAIVTTRALRSLLFEVSPTDPLTLGIVATLLIAIAALASYIPARRAARVDPIEALRAE